MLVHGHHHFASKFCFTSTQQGAGMHESKPLVLTGHSVPHFKGLVCTYMEPKAQKHNVYRSMFCTLLKMGVFGENMQFSLVSFH